MVLGLLGLPSLRTWLVCAGLGVFHRGTVFDHGYVGVPVWWGVCACLFVCVSAKLNKTLHVKITFLTLLSFCPFCFVFFVSLQGSMESCNTTEEEDMKGRKGTLSTFHVICMFYFSLLLSTD